MMSLPVHVRRIRLWLSATLCSLLAGVTPVSAQNQGIHLTILAGEGSVRIEGSQRSQYLAGTSAMMMVFVNHEDGTLVTREDSVPAKEWPMGFTVDVSTSDGVKHPEWLSEMNFQRYIPWILMAGDSLKSAKGPDIPMLYKAERFDFMFTIPIEAVGETLSISARYDHPRYGHLETLKPALLDVVAVQLGDSSLSVWDDRICYALVASRREEAMTLADSAIAQGYTGENGLRCALMAAVESDHYEAALRYLDLNWAANRMVSFERGDDLPTYPRPKPTRAEKLQARERLNQSGYRRLRSEYLQKIAQQEQQH